MYSIIDLCLLCLTKNKNLKSISSRDSDGVLVEEKLRFFLFELGKIDPEILKQICLPCLEKLNYIYNYKQQCLRNIDKLNTYKYVLNTSKERCTNLQVQSDTNNLLENQVKSENKDSSEPVISESINLDNVIVKKEPSVDDTETKFVLQGEHGQKPEIEQLLKEDIVMNQKPDHNSDNNKAQEENAITGIEDTKITEDEVKFEFVDVLVKEEPEDFYDETDTRSKLCDLKEELQNEIANNAESLSTLKTAPRSTEEKGQHKCSECNKSFKHRCELIKHGRTHTGEKPFKCDKCDKAFSQVSHLIRHKHSHTSDKPFKCDMCDKTFNRTDKLTVHKHTHTKERPFKCDVCNKAFGRKSNLTCHKRIHTGEKPYKCDVCGKAFCEKASLIKHSRTHTGEKPFECTVCGKAFSQRSNLIAHKLTHNTEKQQITKQGASGICRQPSVACQTAHEKEVEVLTKYEQEMQRNV